MTRPSITAPGLEPSLATRFRMALPMFALLTLGLVALVLAVVAVGDL